jgi:O-antigen ligase
MDTGPGPPLNTPSVATRRDWLALLVLQAGVVGVVVAALPYKLFDLDRFFIPKELVLHVSAGLAAFLLVTRRPSPSRVAFTWLDALLATFLVVSTISAVFAANWWLAWRALAISYSAAVLFWSASALRRVGLYKPLLLAVGVAVIAGATGALIQAYFGTTTELFSLNRAPGGTFGNRNFMAHLCAIGAPALALATLVTSRRWMFIVGLVGMTIVAAALVLSRSRAAWLALVAAAVAILLIAFIARARFGERNTRRRLLMIAAAAGTGALVAAFLPNKLEWRSSSPYLDSVRDVVNYREGSGRGRLVQYTNSLGMTAEDPLLGVGPGNWPVAYPKFASRRDPSLAGDEGMTDNPWPSSDWVAFLAERGALATVCLALALLGLVGRALADLLRSKETLETERSATSLILIGTVAAAVVVGTFDAALLLAVPATVVWILAGSLAPAGKASLSIERGVRLAPVLIVVLSAAAVGRSALQMAAMSTANASTRTAALDRAARLDPGSYKIRIRAATAMLARGNCGRAVVHARAARELFPTAGEPKRVLRSCGKG